MPNPPWLLTVGDSHLYPGVRVGGPGASDWARWQAGDALWVEFADLTAGDAWLQAPAPQGWLVQLAARRTAKGAAIPAQTWLIASTPTRPGTLRIRRPGN